MPESSGGIKRLLSIIRRLENITLMLLLSAMIALAAGQIVLRNLFGTGLAWGDPLLRILVLWLGLAGAIVATRENHHISINVLTRLLPAGAQVATRCLTELFAAAICGVIAFHSARFVFSERQAHTIAFSTVPAWICELILPVAFAIIAIRFLASAAGRAGGLIMISRRT